MDISMFRSGHLQLKNLFTRISKLQKNRISSKSHSELRILAKGIALLLVAILFAWIGKNETENATQVRVLQTQWPPPQVLNGVLKQGGWKRQEKVDLSSILKNHPDPFSSKPMIWESNDHCFLYLILTTEPELWSCATSHNSTHLKLKWIKVGSGYEGINRLAQIMAPFAKKTVTNIDPKEIRY